jgi:hypothetical protein
MILAGLVGGFGWSWLDGYSHAFASICQVFGFYGFNGWRHSASLCFVHLGIG